MILFSDSHVSILYQKERNADPCIPPVDFLAEETESGYQEHVGINLDTAHVETFCRDRYGNGSIRFLDTRNLSEQSDGSRQGNIPERSFCIKEQNVGDKFTEKTIYSGTEIGSTSATVQGEVYYGHGQEMVHNTLARKSGHTVLENESNATLQTDSLCAGEKQSSDGVVNTPQAVFKEHVTCTLAGHMAPHGIESNFEAHFKGDEPNSDFENQTMATSHNYFPSALQPANIQEITSELVKPPNTVGQDKYNINDAVVNKKMSQELSLPDLARSTAITTPTDVKSKATEAETKSHQLDSTEPVEADGQADFSKHSENSLCKGELTKARQELKLVSSRMSLRSKQTQMRKHVEKQRKKEHTDMGSTDSSDLAKDNENKRSSNNRREVSYVVEKHCKEKEHFKKKYKDKTRTRKSQQKKKSGNKSLVRKRRNNRIEQESVADENQSKTDKNKKVNIYCKDCEHVFKYQKNYDKHLAEGKCRHVCEYCGKVFLNGLTGNYKIHLKYHLKLKNHECHICGKKYIEYRKLKEHYRKHSGEKPYMCDECGQTFSGFGSLYAHKKNKHVGIREKYSCSQCPKVFKGYSGLLFHIKYYHTSPSEKPYSCAKCEKTFKTPDILKRHETVHRETKDFKCDQCDAAFKRIQGLTEHKKRHTKEYTYFCSHCGKGFYTRQATVVHERVHTGEKPYSCSICNYTCSLNGNLKKHMKTHERHF